MSQVLVIAPYIEFIFPLLGLHFYSEREKNRERKIGVRT